jgi:hypothetical protein
MFRVLRVDHRQMNGQIWLCIFRVWLVVVYVDGNIQVNLFPFLLVWGTDPKGGWGCNVVHGSGLSGFTPVQ